MTPSATASRNRVAHSLYQHIFKPVLFRNDPEAIHERMVRLGSMLGRHQWGRGLVAGLFEYEDPILQQEIRNISFRNPVGLSAGFDKDAQLTDILPSVGFGFAEVGSITGEKCIGNPKPRLWRLPKSRSLVVYYGLKNDGCEAVSHRLRGKHFSIPLGVSVAMTNCAQTTKIEDAIADFAKAFRVMEPIGDYITVNVSCPNTYGGQPFVVGYNLDRLFDALDTIPTEKPVFIKLSPDLIRAELDIILDIARVHRIHGIITTNLTKDRDNRKIIDADLPLKGGLSGKVVQDLADDMLAYIYKREGKRFILIGNGGIFTAEDAYKKIRLGASLVQLITGMVFEGPQLISEINLGLARLLRRDGFTSISQAVGIDNSIK